MLVTVLVPTDVPPFDNIGDSLRFQIFGETVNQAGEMEKHCLRNRIHVSEATAELLRAAGKGKWLQPHASKMFLKGSGEVQTYYVNPEELSSLTSSASSRELVTENDSSESTENNTSNVKCAPLLVEKDKKLTDNFSPRVQRLVKWNVSTLEKVLRQIVAARQSSGVLHEPVVETRIGSDGEATVLDEVQEVVKLQKGNAKPQSQIDVDNVILGPKVSKQLHFLCAKIASHYPANSFHNFEHASHVTMSVVKLLRRIVTQGDTSNNSGKTNKKQGDAYGITSDPLTQFAVVLSALIHDLDHPGVPNSTLVKEGSDMAVKYKNKSVAEQHSVDLFWDMLMKDDEMADLKACIYSNQSELEHFRSIVVNGK